MPRTNHEDRGVILLDEEALLVGLAERLCLENGFEGTPDQIVDLVEALRDTAMNFFDTETFSLASPGGEEKGDGEWHEN